MKKEIRIENLPIVEEFTKHFSMEENKRILFSAPFGTGKSTFLQEYFSNQDVKCIHLTLYPINYAVAANEDVFELIKYDLLLELLVRYGDDIELSKEEFGILFSGQYFIYDQLKLRGIISKIISLGDKLGKPVFQLLKNFDETVTDIESFKNKMEKDEKAFLQEYLKSMERKAGSITEMDDISLLIFNLIERLIKKKSTENEKFYSVLIIDDLDRMDPDHIFRLFNIFSSHYDVVSNKNKFGFNKVIFVCDIENIRKIYSHKYGDDVDFSGYIDRFYSKDIYEFDNIKLIKQKLGALIGEYESDVSKTHERHRLESKESVFYEIFCWIIFTFLEAKEINLRMIIQKENLKIPDYSFHLPNKQIFYKARNYDFLVLISYLKTYFVSYDILDHKLKRIAEKFTIGFNPVIQENTTAYDQIHIEKNILNMLAPFILPKDKGFPQEHESVKPETYYLSEFKASIHFGYDTNNFSRIHSPYIERITGDISPNVKDVPIDLNIYALFYFAFKKCRNEGVLKENKY